MLRDFPPLPEVPGGPVHRLPNRSWIAAGVLALGLLGGTAEAASLEFSGYRWKVRAGSGGPGPNVWEERNVWLDARGFLHLKIRHDAGKWSCAEVTLDQRLGLGRYRFEVEAPWDQFGDRVVLGLFNYPTADVGGDGTHEIDIEFARWGRIANPLGNFTVWPVDKSLKPTSKTFAVSPHDPGVSLHEFAWTSNRVEYSSRWGDEAKLGDLLGRWTYAPEDAERRVSRQPMPVHLNLWLFQGKPPAEGGDVEVVVRRFRFEPAVP